MNLRDSFELNSPRGSVWEFLQDIPRVSECMPGIEAVEKIEPDVYRGRLGVKVGPIKSSFAGKVSILERTPPSRLVMRAEADDRSSASRVKATFTVNLIAAESGTRIDYEMDVALRGRLAQFGSTVFRATAKRMTAEFARNVQLALDSGV